MSRLGVDYAFDRPTSPAAVRAAGYSFACRYLGGSKSKDLTKAEADDLIAAGLDIVCNWENSASAALSGRAQGVKDAQQALAQATAAGMPTTRPIYFSVDFDASAAQQPAINAYFDGVASVLGHSRTGAYGGYYVIQRLFDAGKIAWGWQTYAWSGGHWDSRAQMRQEQNGILVAGADSDKDEAMATDFGQWGATPAPTPPASEDDMGVIAKDAKGQYYLCLNYVSYPIEPGHVVDVRYLAGQGVYQLATGLAANAEWTDGGQTRLGWTAEAFGPVWTAGAGAAQGDPAALAAALTTVQLQVIGTAMGAEIARQPAS
jgi:hypothetical protein